MKGPKMSTGSICNHGKRHENLAVSTKGRRVPSTTKSGLRIVDSKETHLIHDDVANLHNDKTESEENGEPEGDCVHGDKSVTHETVVVAGSRDDIQDLVDTESIDSETTKTHSSTDIATEKRQIVVNMNTQEGEEEPEDDVFENDLKNCQEETVCKKVKSLDSKKENDLDPINECDESDIPTTGTDDQETEIEKETPDKGLQASLLTNENTDIKSTVKTDKVKHHPLKRPKSEKFRRPKSSTISDKTKRRPQSCVVPARPSSSSGRTARVTIVPTLRVTKAELEYYLPKRSFFSCHDKALKDAGYGPAKTPRQTRMIEAWAKQAESKSNGEEVLTPLDIENTLDNQPTAVEELGRTGDDDLQRYPSESLSEVDHRESVSSVSQLHDNRLSRQVSNVSLRSNATVTRKLSRLSRRRGDYEEDEIRVDFQPLLQYLKYISENPDEYLQQNKQFKYGVPSQDSIVKMGNIFRRGRHGLSTDSLLVHVVHGINPRFSDPSQWTNTNKEKTLYNLTSSKKESGPLLSKHESHDSGTGTDEPKTEFEKIKHKMDAWLKTVTTAQLVKAKELALRELGEEDVAQSRWWVSLKSCHYLR
ncbi:uncharacterized protein LOC132558689 [Ylistrum balloti]|uniref:uncharacterized protein LOC132558689 n=1 Tax=Ylistrum balloti TaxID=509963 RepID=UPI002905E86C|nr:uncharacterized protein LOC132558689 [Ylistrum balloti]